MVFKKWYNAQNERYLAAKAERNDPEAIQRKADEKAARKAAADAHKGVPTGLYGAHSFLHGTYQYFPEGHFKQVTKDIAGATAEFEAGAGQANATAGRVIAGALIAGPAGAIVGGMFKKEKGRAYVYVTFADGDVAIVDGPLKDESKLRMFAANLNAASKHYAAQ